MMQRLLVAAGLAAALAAPFTPGNIVVLQVGDGTTSLTSATSTLATRATIVEVNAATGTIVQSIPLQTGVTGCGVGGMPIAEGVGVSLSSDGRFLSVPCYAVPAGHTLTTTSGTVTYTLGSTRTVVRVGADGVPDYSTHYTAAATEQIRGAAFDSTNGRHYVATNVGIRSVPHGGGPAVTFTSATSVRSITLTNTTMLAQWAGTPGGVIRVAGWPFPTGPAGSLVINTAALVLGPTSNGFVSSVMENENTIWATANLNGFCLYKIVRNEAGVWANASGYPRVNVQFTYNAALVTMLFLRGLAGMVDPSTGVYTLYATTSNVAGNNYLLRINTVTGVATPVLRAPGAFFDFRAVAVAPFSSASISNTPSWSPTASLTPSASSSPSATATLSTGGSPSPTRTDSPSPSNTPSNTASPSVTASGTPLPCVTDFTPRSMAPDGTSILATRLGDGLAALPSTMSVYRPIFVDEISLATGAILQTIAVPTDVPSGGCVGQTNIAGEVYISRATDSTSAVVSCMGIAPGVTVGAAQPRVVARIGPTGGWSHAGSFFEANQPFRSVVATSTETPGAPSIFLTTGGGVRSLTVGTFNASVPPALSPVMAGTFRGATLFNGALYAVSAAASATVGVVRVTDLAATAQTPTYLPGINTATGLTTGVVSVALEAAHILYTSDLAGSVTKWVLDEATGIWGHFYTKPALWMLDVPGGTQVNVTGFRGMTGATIGGRFNLVGTTGFASATFGSNFIVRFDTFTEEFIYVKQACMWAEYRSVALAPIPPTPTPTPSATASFGSSPSSSASASTTPTPSPSQYCSLPTAAPAPLTPGSLLALRVGNGRDVLSSISPVASTVYLDEIDPTTGARLQTLQLPNGFPTFRPDTGALASAGCVLNSNSVFEGLPSRTADGAFAYVTCVAAPAGSALLADGVNTKTIHRIAPDGTTSVVAVFNTWTHARTSIIRGVATIDGSWMWTATGAGVYAVPHGAGLNGLVPNATVVTQNAGWRTLVTAGGGLYATAAGNTPTGSSSVQLIGGAAAVGLAPTVSPAPAPIALPGTTAPGGYMTSMVWDGLNTVYTVDNVIMSAALNKFTRATSAVTATWAVAPGYPKYGFNASDGSVIATGGRGSTGWRDPATGTLFLMIATPAGIVKYNTVAETSELLSATCGISQIRGLTLAPVVPSPSSSPSNSRTATQSATGSASASATSSPTATMSLSSGASISSSASSTPSPSATSTGTPSPSALCAVPVAAPGAPFTPGNVLVTRTGNGRTPLTATTTGRDAYIDEYNPSTGALVQSIALPASGSVTYDGAGQLVSAPCTLSSSFVNDGQFTRSTNGELVSLVCYTVPVGAAYNAAFPKQLVAITSDGAVTTRGLYVSNAATVRSAVSVDGSSFYVSSSAGIEYVLPSTAAGNVPNSTAVTSTANSYRGLTFGPGGGLYAAGATVTGLVHLVGGASAAAAPPTSSPAPAPFALPGASWLNVALVSVVFQDELTLWTLDPTTGNTKVVSKYTRPNASSTAVWARERVSTHLNYTFTDVNGTVFTASAFPRGSTGWTDSTGTFHLLIASSAGVLRYNTVDESVTRIVPPCDFVRYMGVALVPVAASPTPTPTSSASASPSFNPSASVSSSLSASPSTTGTPSITPTPSVTGSPQLCAPPAPPAPFTPGSLVVVRVGSGTVLVTGTSIYRELYVDEIDGATGARIQSIALPTGNATWGPEGGLHSAGCLINGANTYEGYVGRSLAGGSLFLVCNVMPVGFALTGSGTKQILRVSHDGTTSTVALFNTFTAAGTTINSVRAVASVDGSYFFISTGAGVYGVAAGAGLSGPGSIPNATQLSTPMGVRDLEYLPEGGLVTTFANPTTTVSSVLLVGGAAHGLAPPSTTTLISPSPLPGLAAVPGGLITQAVFEGPTTLYTYDAGAPFISKFTRAAVAVTATWAMAPGYPKFGFNTSDGALLSFGGRGGAGWTDPATGTFYLVVATLPGLVKFNTATGVSALLGPAPCMNTRYVAVALAPVLPPTPSNSPTRSETPSLTASVSSSQTASSTNTASRSPSGSVTAPRTPTSTLTTSSTETSSASGTGSASNTGTPSRTGTPSASGTRTGTPSSSETGTQTGTPSSSGTSSVSATSSETASVSSSQTGTPSASATETGTPSASATETGTPSSSETSTGTGTPSSSGTGTSSPTGTATRTMAPSQTPSKTKVALPSPTPTRTRSRTATRTKTKTRTRTRTRTRTPSKKKKVLLE